MSELTKYDESEAEMVRRYMFKHDVVEYARHTRESELIMI